jgi:nucleotide-binding universal stress UspA family protein
MRSSDPFEHVIVGVDGRQGGRDAIALARWLVAPTGALTLTHVRSSGLFPPGARAEASGAVAAAAAGEGAKAAARAPEALGADGARELLERERADAELEARMTGVVAASVGRGLHELAEREGADLVVVGSSHRGFLGRVFLGDDTRASLNGAPCAVAVAPLAYARELGPVRTIGVGYDDSDESKAALTAACELASRCGARVRAKEIVQMPGAFYAGFGGVAWGNTLETMLDAAKRKMAELDGVEGDAELGLTGEELAAFGDDVDLLVVGSRSYGPVRRLILGSTSHYLAGHARCPLLVLPRGTDEQVGNVTEPGQDEGEERRRDKGS